MVESTVAPMAGLLATKSVVELVEMKVDWMADCLVALTERRKADQSVVTMVVWKAASKVAVKVESME